MTQFQLSGTEVAELCVEARLRLMVRHAQELNAIAKHYEGRGRLWRWWFGYAEQVESSGRDYDARIAVLRDLQHAAERSEKVSLSGYVVDLLGLSE